MLKSLKSFFRWEFYEDLLIGFLKFFIRRNPISPFYAFWKTLFVAKEWKSFKSYFQKFDKHFSSHHPFVSAFGSFIFIFLLISGTFWFVFNGQMKEAKADWWNDSWHYRKEIKINHAKVAGDLSDFPVLISITDSNVSLKAQSDGDDIIFTDSVSKQKLSHEIESYDNATGKLIAWVKVPNLSSSVDTVLYMYYGNATVSSGQDTENVWDSNFKLVQHLEESGADIRTDSTANNNDGTPFNFEGDEGVDNGKINGANYVDDAGDFGDYIDFGSDESLSGANGFTSSFWIKRDVDSSYEWPHAFGHGSGHSYYEFRSGSYGSGLYFEYGKPPYDGSSFSSISLGGSENLSLSEWHFFVVTYDGNTLTTYRDGVYIDQKSDIVINPNFTSVQFGGSSNQTLASNVDEIRFSNSPRSASWIQTEYNNQNDPTAFLLLQAEEVGLSPVGYWSFDEGYGTVAHDESSNGNDGTITGATWKNESECVSGKCLDFDKDADTNVILDTDLNELAEELTVSVWVKPQAAPDGTGRVIVGAYDFDATPGLTRGWTLGNNYGSSDYISMSVYDTSGNGKVINYANFFAENLNKWTYVTGVFKPSEYVHLYVNGKKVGENKTDIPSHIGYSGNFNLTIGRRADAVMHGKWHGQIDEPKIYPYAQTAEQIKQDYNAGLAGQSSSSGAAVAFGSESDKWMSDGLVGYWKMDEASWNGTAGEVVDASGNGNHGTRNGDATTGSGKYGNGGFFDGNGDRVVIGDSDNFSFGANPLTIASWVKFDSSGLGTYEMIVSQNADSFELNKNSSNQLRLEMRYSDDTVLRGNELTASLNEVNRWYFVVATFSPFDGTIKLYVDGEGQDVNYEDVKRGGILKNSVSDVYIGSRNTGPDCFNGSLDETRVYNRALSPDEIKKLYEYAPGPVMHLKMDEKEGTTAFDTSGNGNYVTLGADGAGADVPTWSSTGKMGSALRFDGIDDYTKTSTSTLNGSQLKTALTVSAWVKTNSVSANQGIFSKGYNFGASQGLNFILRDSGKVNVWMGDGIAASSLTSADSYSAGEWFHVSMTWDGLNRYIYINGKKDTNISTFNGSINYNESASFVGSSWLTGSHFNGQIDDIRVYDYARTQKQILEDMHNGDPLKGAVLDLSFDEGVGDVAHDASVSGNDGALVPGTTGENTTTSAMWTKEGKKGGAMEFDGTNDYVEIANESHFDFTDAVAISAWVYPKANTTQVIASKSGYGIDSFRLTYMGWDQFFRFEINDQDLDSGIYPRNSGWYHLLVTYDKNQIKMYINGKLENAAPYTSAITVNDNALRIGRTPVSDTYNFQGFIDEVKIHNYALSEDEIGKVYNDSKGMVMGDDKSRNNNGTPVTGAHKEYCIPGDTAQCDKPVLELKMDEKAGSTAFDTSGNGNDCELTTDGGNWTKGKYGSAARFNQDGINNGIDCGNGSSLNINDVITINYWMKGDPEAIISYGSFFSKMNLGTSGFAITTFETEPIIYMRVDTSAGINQTGISTTKIDGVFDNTWHYISWVLDSGARRGYKDGVLVASDTYNHGDGFSASGANFSGLYSPIVDIDDVKVYNYARTPAQIAWDYNRGKPVAEWRFDEGEGMTVHDESGGDKHGTMTNMDATTDWVAGKNNKALDFDGVNDYVNISNFDILSGNAETTTSTWFKINQFPSSGLDSVYNAPNWSMYSDIKPTGALRCGFSVSGVAVPTTDAIVELGKWYHMTCIYDGSKVSMYLNGSLAATSSMRAGVINSFSEFNISKHGSSDIYHFNGQIDEFKIYNYALTEEQVKSDYNGGAMNFR